MHRTGKAVMDNVLIRNHRRRLGFRQWGAADGFPVFLLHGTPGCRLSVGPDDAELLQLDTRLITYDRPGYGLSDPQPGRSVADAAEDVRAIADSLGLGSFAVLGRSGGGPHALACAALLPDRVTRVASLVGPAPFDAPGLDWLKGMVEHNRRHYVAARLGLRELAHVMYPQVIAMRHDPEHLLRELGAQASADDLDTFDDPQARAALIESFTEAIGRSLDGWAADNLALTHPWGFDPGWITAPVLLWHGTWDVFIPVAHARWLAGRIGHAVLLESERSSHMSAAAVQSGVIGWLRNGGVPHLSAA